MSFGMCCLLCFLAYRLGVYNTHNPGVMWERMLRGWGFVRKWSQS